jgi:hypothetical protein
MREILSMPHAELGTLRHVHGKMCKQINVRPPVAHVPERVVIPVQTLNDAHVRRATELLDSVQVLPVIHEQDQLGAPINERANKVRANEARPTGNEDFLPCKLQIFPLYEALSPGQFSR